MSSGQKLESFSSAQSTRCHRSAAGVYGGKQKDTWDPPRIAQKARLSSKLASLSRLDVSTIDCIRGSQLSLCFRQRVQYQFRTVARCLGWRFHHGGVISSNVSVCANPTPHRICEAPSMMLYLGGGGINSTAASHAFVTDTWFMQTNGKVLGGT